MLIAASSAAPDETLALLATFLGVGIVANVVIVYIIAQVFAERKENQERRDLGP